MIHGTEDGRLGGAGHSRDSVACGIGVFFGCTNGLPAVSSHARDCEHVHSLRLEPDGPAMANVSILVVRVGKR